VAAERAIEHAREQFKECETTRGGEVVFAKAAVNHEPLEDVNETGEPESDTAEDIAGLPQLL